MTTFTTRLRLLGNNSGIPVPDDVVAGFSAGKRVPVVVTIGDYSYRNTVAPYRGEYMISLSAAHRQASGLTGDEEVEVTLEVDSAPRQAEVPADFADALAADGAAKAAFDRLSYSAQSRFTLDIIGAKTADTRQRRIDKALTTLRGE
ncbi:YdeI/OmpD-associated family protein [Glaciibacter sp. 2TAF33]|uniref:YdeI/OmpD-associated family protein n=1 Tax=Glaciibacter sp. 2TAF33 TaxID=3233015 RepID=UPI003F908CAA